MASTASLPAGPLRVQNVGVSAGGMRILNSVDLTLVDIPFLLQRLFAVKPEALDIMDYDIVFAELDSSNLRARVKVRVKVKLLLDETIQEREFILYFDRDSVDDPWYMKLEDSLRELSPDSTKRN